MEQGNPIAPQGLPTLMPFWGSLIPRNGLGDRLALRKKGALFPEEDQWAAVLCENGERDWVQVGNKSHEQGALPKRCGFRLGSTSSISDSISFFFLEPPLRFC